MGAELKDEGVKALCTALPQMNLATLQINRNYITVRGARVLADTLPKCQQLDTLFLTSNPLGAAGAEALVAALPQCTVLDQLSLESCDLDEQAKKALRQAWAQQGKTANHL